MYFGIASVSIRLWKISTIRNSVVCDYTIRVHKGGPTENDSQQLREFKPLRGQGVLIFLWI